MKVFANVKTLPLYPLLFALYPILALLGFNIDETAFNVVWRLLFFVTSVVLVVMLLLYLPLRNWHRAAIITTILVLLFFTYGHLYSYLKMARVFGFVLGRHRQLLPLWAVIAALGSWWTIRRLKDPQKLAPALNLISIFLLVYPLFQTVSYVASEYRARQALLDSGEEAAYASSSLGYAPDVYYIILDAYGRADTLQTVFGYDNSQFLNFLRSRGFYVADCAQSNYSQTVLSLSSSLNLNYVDVLVPNLDLNAGPDDKAPLVALGQHSATRQMLESMGYKTISFSTKFPVSEWKDADYYFEPPARGLNDFELLFAQTTVWRAFMDILKQPVESKFANWERRRTLFLLEQLNDKVTEIPGPKFVFAHFIIPHRPYVFGPNGEEVDAKFYQLGKLEFDVFSEGYINQVRFINTKIEQVVDLILENSSNPPVIIIQGDHGPDFWAVGGDDAPDDVNISLDFQSHRAYILNAYYFPDGSSGLYPTISPVNSFRLVFNKFFGKNYEMLEDVSRFSTRGKPYKFSAVPPGCGEIPEGANK